VNRGNEWAWCKVTIVASWKGLEGRDYLGCCNYNSKNDFMASNYYREMINNAIVELNVQCEKMLSLLLSHSYDESLYHENGMGRNGFVDPTVECLEEDKRRTEEYYKTIRFTDHPTMQPDARSAGYPTILSEVDKIADEQQPPVVALPYIVEEVVSPQESIRRAQLEREAAQAKERLNDGGTLIRVNADPSQPFSIMKDVRNFGGRSLQVTNNITNNMQEAHTFVMGHLAKAINLENPPMALRLGESALAAHYALKLQRATMISSGRATQEPKLIQDLDEAIEQVLERAQRLLVEFIMPGSLAPQQRQ
jgi:hypothetical protein